MSDAPVHAAHPIPSAHHHDHDHHAGFGGAALTFLFLGAAEIVSGIIVGNPAVTNLGVHDIGDAILPTMAVGVSLIAIYIRRHFAQCQADKWAAFLVGVANIVVIGGFTIVSIPSSINQDQVILGSASGVISFSANLYWSRQLDCADDVKRRAVSIHLRLDAIAAVAVAAGSFIAYVVDSTVPAVIAAACVLLLTITHSLPEIVSLTRQFHRKVNHPQLPAAR